MEVPGDQLLSGAVFARDEHAGLARSDALDRLPQRLDRRRVAEDRVAADEGLAQRFVRAPQAVALHGVPERHEEPLASERLLDEIEGPLPRRLDGGLDRAVPGHHDDGQRRPLRLDGLEQLDAVHPGHLHVAEDDADFRVVLQGLHGGLRVRGLGHRDRLVLEDHPHRVPDRLLVVDDENLRSRPPSGSCPPCPYNSGPSMDADLYPHRSWPEPRLVRPTACRLRSAGLRPAPASPR